MHLWYGKGKHKLCQGWAQNYVMAGEICMNKETLGAFETVQIADLQIH